MLQLYTDRKRLCHRFSGAEIRLLDQTFSSDTARYFQRTTQLPIRRRSPLLSTMPDLPQLIETGAVMVAGTMVGNELAVAIFFHPRISALDDATHARAARALAAALGRAMPFWYALTLVLSLGVAFYARPGGTPGHGMALTAAILFGATIAYTVLFAVPINKKVAQWKPESLPSNWRELRLRWDRLHAIRVVVILVALFLMVSSTLSKTAG
jgi:hypothetical protein